MANKKHNIDLSEFNDLYRNKGLIYKELAEHFGCSLGTIRRFAKRHKVTPIRGKSKHRKILIEKSKIRTDLSGTEVMEKYQDTLTSKQLEIILGSLLGDSYCKTRKNVGNDTVNIIFGHSEDQLDFLKKTYNDLKNAANPINKMRDGKIANFKTDKKYQTKSFYSFSTVSLNTYLNEITKRHGKKHVTMNWLKLLTPVSLAHWYMDDGSLNLQNRVIRLATMGFSRKENNVIKDYFYEYLKMPCFIAKTKDGSGCEIVLTQNSTKKFIRLISPYIYDSMMYKCVLPNNNDPVETLKAESNSVSKEVINT